VLGVAPTATLAEIKTGYLELARECHPDKTDSVHDVARFADATAAYEVLTNMQQRQLYDLAFEASNSSGKRAKPGEGALEATLREDIEANKVDAAIEKWVVSGSSLKILLHIISVCHIKNKMPHDVTRLLDILHASEAPQPVRTAADDAVGESTHAHDECGIVDGPACGSSSCNGSRSVGGGEGNGSSSYTTTSVTQFVERKTRAYNDLIRLCDAAGSREELFQVLDAMEANAIQVDMDTWMVLEEVFTLGTVRHNPNR
jgi:curved DNA-binding protein CbpA